MGMELFAVAVVVLLFFVVLKQFSFWDPLSMEGKLSFGLSFTINPVFHYTCKKNLLYNMLEYSTHIILLSFKLPLKDCSSWRTSRHKSGCEVCESSRENVSRLFNLAWNL